MKLLLVLLTALLTAGVALAEDPAEQVKKIDHQWADATLRNDAAALGLILADDLRYVHGNASVMNKKEFIASLESGDLVYHSIDYEDLDARVFGGSAVVMSKLRLHITMNGEDQKFEVRFLRVYVRRKGAWQLLAHQATRLG